jgi:hypothetical protein
MEDIKRMAGIPDRTLQKIVDESGGALDSYLDGKKVRQKLRLGGRTFDAATNTELITQVFASIVAAGAICLMFAPLPAISAQCNRPGVIQLAPGYNYANVYASASAKSAVLTQLGDGDKFCILGTGTYFHKVQVGSIVGFIARR